MTVETLQGAEFSSTLRGLRVNFVCPKEAQWPELREVSEFPLSEEVLSRRSGGLMDTWVLRPYHGLRALGHEVSLSERVLDGHINIVSAHDFGRRDRLNTAFVVCARGDAHFPRLANYVINQNFLVPSRRNIGAIHHFPQPNLIRRGRERRARIEKLSFKGHLSSLDPAFRSPSFRAELARIGVSMEVDARNKSTSQHSWNDYSETDLVLAVRNLTIYDAGIKPASKLVNAWRAGVPALLGPEPAFEALRKSPLDFISIRSPEEALREIKRLQNDPGTYLKMVENGLWRGQDFEERKILADWVALLSGPIRELASEWYAIPPSARVLAVASGIVREPFSKRMHKLRFRNGRRILALGGDSSISNA